MQLINYSTENFLKHNFLRIYTEKLDNIINLNYILIILFIVTLYISYIVYSKFKKNIYIKLDNYDDIINKLNIKLIEQDKYIKIIRENNEEFSSKYKTLLSNVVKSREILIKSKKILNEINELNELTIEVNKNWNGIIYFCNPYIGLLDIKGGNSNSWGKDNNYLKDQRNTWLDKLNQFKIRLGLCGIDIDTNSSMVYKNDCVNQYYIIRNIELAELEYLRNIQELDKLKY